ncbi:hypothetical protein VPH35_055768 [Triticum aestivum]
MPKPKKMLEADQGFHNDLNRTQDNLRNTRNNGANMTMKALGGFVRTFYFDEESNADVINGTTQIEYDIEMLREYPITVVVLENKDNSSEIGDAIVGHTEKLSCYGGDLIVQAYFSVFSHKIHKYIMAYERFTPSSIRGICNRPFFSANGLQSRLDRILAKKNEVQLLYYAARCEIRHGSLSNPTSYVTCRGDLRIINKGRVFHDRYEAATVHNFRRIVFGHPILLGTVLEKLECFVTLHHGMTELDDLRRFLSSDLFQDKVGSEYDYRFRRLVPWSDLYYRLCTFRQASNLKLTFLYDLRYNDWSPRYGERYIYINIIRLVQNLIKHGAEYCEIKTRFSHNMCACYTLLNIKKDWINETSSEPYGLSIFTPTEMM